ncbi:MAG: hypothetical protein KBD56_03815 [Candidatus Eisenbacteria bacterium]|nr:hypothetical protein [Candidatus Eisenbacteria bacterium]
MKDQYAGDINDYRKYGLLRRLGSGLHLTVCWMWTPDDARNDGSRIEYLANPNLWRRYDPELFDALDDLVRRRGHRSVGSIERTGILEARGRQADLLGARRLRFHSVPLADDGAERDRYFRALWKLARGSDLLFFDPDNGLEIDSCRRGTRGSSRYLYAPEVEEAWTRGFFLLIYQHFPRVDRERYLAGRTSRLREWCPGSQVASFATSHVAFFLVALPVVMQALEERVAGVRRNWADQFAIRLHAGR